MLEDLCICLPKLYFLYYLSWKFGAFEGVTSNTDAGYLAETFAEAKCPTKVIPIVFILIFKE